MKKDLTPSSLYGNSREYLKEQEKKNELLADIAGVEYESPGDIPNGKYVIEKRLLDAAQAENEILEAMGGGGGGAAKGINIDYGTDIISLKNKDGDVIDGSGATLPAYGVTFDPTTGGLTLTKNGTAMSGQTVTIPNYGSPVGVTDAADMVDEGTIYLYEGETGGGFTNGHFYYYDGTAWADGGEYAAATVQTDKTLLVENRAADAKATGEAVGELKTQLDHIGDVISNEFAVDYSEYAATGVYISTSTGKWASSNSRGYGIIPIPDYSYKVTVSANSITSGRIALLKTDAHTAGTVPDWATGEDSLRVTPVGTTESYVIPSDCKFIYIAYNNGDEDQKPASVIVDYYVTPLVVDNTLTNAGEAADAKVTGDKLRELKTQIDENLLDYVETINPTNWYNPDATTSGIMEVNGSVTQNAEYIYTDYIPVKENDVIACYKGGTDTKLLHYRIATFDENKNVSGEGMGSNSTSNFTIQSGIAYAVVTFKTSTAAEGNKPMIVLDGIRPQSYSAYFEPYNIYTKDFLTPDTAQAISNLQTAVNYKASVDALSTEISRATAAENRKVNIPLDEHNIPDNGTDGQLLRTKGDGSTEWASYAEPTQSQVDSAVELALGENPSWRLTVDNGSITDAKFSNTLKLQTIKEYYTPEMYGAVGDGSTDDKLAIESMLEDVPDNALCVFYKNYYISDGITIDKPVNIMMYGKLEVARTANFCICVSGHDVRRNHFRLNLKVSGAQEQWGWTHNTIGLDCVATFENTFDISCEGFKTGVRLISTTSDCTYNKFFIRYIYNCKTAILLTGTVIQPGTEERAGATSQNTFIGGRIGVQGSSYEWLSEEDTDDAYYAVKSVLVSGRTNNNNNFISCSFEGYDDDLPSSYNNRARVLADLMYCVFLGCRFEGITQFESQDKCVVISGYGFSSIPNKIGNCTKIGIPNMIGNMKFENGRPQWYDGTKWVYADGTNVPTP